MLIQVFPLFLIPEVLFPWLHHNALMPQALIDNLFPPIRSMVILHSGAYGFILAWPYGLEYFHQRTTHVVDHYRLRPNRHNHPLLICVSKGAHCG